MTYRSRNGRIAFVFAMALASTAAGALLMPNEARADDCLLDSNNDGVATATTDTDGGANSSGNDTRLACGIGAVASGTDAMAIGWTANASGTFATAIGWAATSSGSNAVALGDSATASGTSSLAV